MDDTTGGASPIRDPGHGGVDQDLPSLVEADVRTTGFVVVHDVVPSATCEALAGAVDEAVAEDARWITNRPEEYGRVLSLVRYQQPFLDLLGHEPLMDPFDRVLGDDCILYTMTTGCLPPGGSPRPLHTDFDQPSGDEVLYLAGLVMLDDFEIATGATRFLPGSRGAEMPDERTFGEQSVAVEGNVGSVCWFDPRLWHTSGTNTTDEWRRAILIGMVRRWMKPRFDHPAMLGSSSGDLSPRVRRVLGFDSRPPASYEQYYARGAAAGRSAVASQPARSSIT